MNARAITPPHSSEAEQAVIGALLMDNSALDKVGGLSADHFYHPELSKAFETIRVLVVANKVADVITVSEAGGGDMTALNDLVMSVPSAANVAGYAEIVMERWAERRLVSAAQETIAEAQAQGRAVEKIDRAMARLTAITSVAAKSESVPADVAVIDFLDRFQKEADGQTEVISTGLADLDKQLAGGLRRGEVMVVGARPKMGKTALTLQMARNIGRSHWVLVCSQEMPVYELVSRNVAALGSINLADMRRPDRMPDDAWSRLTDGVECMRSLNLVLDEQRALTLLDIRRKVMETKRMRGCDVVIVDYLQLMAGDGDNRNQELDRISNGLKAMAGEFDCAVVLLSQLSREADKRHGPPVMTDLRDSGAIEAAADIIALLYREVAHPMGDKGEAWKRHAQLEVVQRNGAPGTVNLWFSGEYQQFKDWDGPMPMKSGHGRSSRARSSGLD